MHLSIIYTAALVAAISPALAFWRLPCQGRLGVARLDPLVNPGQIAPHAHVVHGASNFGMTVTTDDLLNSHCTSCAIKQDKSIYWTPGTYFKYPNGETELVEQVGGMLVYYLPRGEGVKAFPKGFRILAGDPYLRNFTWPVPDPPKSSWSKYESTQFALSQKAVGFNCLNYAGTPEPTLYRHTMPSKKFIDENCPNGIRMEIFFPSCWNGKDLDTDDHKSHMAYPNLVEDGVCPEGFKTRLVSLLYETIWHTAKYKGIEGEFVLSNGDPNGCGYHADFIEAWEPGVLDDAVKSCKNSSGRVEDCGIFNLQSEAEQNKCKFKTPSPIATEGCKFSKNGLPGAVEILRGPEYAKVVTPKIDIIAADVPKVNVNIPVKNAPTTLSPFPVVSSSSRPQPPPPAPTTTTTTRAPAPAQFLAPSENAGDGDTVPISTRTYTEGNVVYEVVIVEEKVTTTIDVPAGATPPAGGKVLRRARRHAHGHRH
ncbi:hypothetical protein PABG_05444 [Paracoccidioides brasiliensis Pb03]|nr:hypothetical protein PABG_05444 [Paracoccidioides brasiliensis Pb03]